MVGLTAYFRLKEARKQHDEEAAVGSDGGSLPIELKPSPTHDSTENPETLFGAANGSSRGSKENSQPPSLYPVGDFRNATAEEINDIKCDVMVNWLHSQQEEKLWVAGEEGEGVVLKKSRGEYTCAPFDLATEMGGLYQAVRTLNVKVSDNLDMMKNRYSLFN